MGQVIRMDRDGHHFAQRLLPWYVTGKVEEAERARVEAHLEACAQCRSDLAAEQRLGAEVASLSFDNPFATELHWAAMTRRLGRRSAPGRGIGDIVAWLRAGPRRIGREWRTAGGGLRLAVLTQLGVILVLVATLSLRPRPLIYHALGAPPTAAAAAADAVVMFRPETSERDLRATLQSNHARLVDGPTAAGGYLVHIPAPELSRSLARLRHSQQILVAEAIDSPGPP